MKSKNKIMIGMIFLAGMLLTTLISGVSFSSPQFSQPGTSFDYLNRQGVGAFPSFEKEQCNAGNDFIVQINPLGCTPKVVRSDLLEEQNVPVFCQLQATQVNPLIDVDAIDSITFSGGTPDAVSGVGFHPARAAIRSSGSKLLNSPILENIGYVVVVLRQYENEDDMPDTVSGNLTANIRYDIEEAFGVGRATYSLPQLSDNEWRDLMGQYGFMNSRGFLRADSVETERATISIYTDENNKVSTFNLQKGQVSSPISVPDFNLCRAGLRLRLDDVENPDTRAKFDINGNIVQIAEGEKFLENKCQVTNVQKRGVNQIAEMRCITDEGGERFQLKISPKIKLDIGGEEREVEVGDRLFRNGDESIYLAYAGTRGDSNDINDLYVYFMASPNHREEMTTEEVESAETLVNQLKYNQYTKVGIIDFTLNFFKSYAGVANLVDSYLRKDKEFSRLTYDSFGKLIGPEGATTVDYTFGGRTINLTGLGKPENREFNESGFRENYENALNDYREILEKFPNEKEVDDSQETYGRQALFEAIRTSSLAQQRAKLSELCVEFEEKYSQFESQVSNYCTDDLKISNSEISSHSVFVNGDVKTISFEGIYEPSIEDYSAEVIVEGPEGIRTFLLTKDRKVYLNQTRNEYIELIDLEQDSAVLNINLQPEGVFETVAKATITSPREKLVLGETESFGSNYALKLDDVNLEKTARVSVLPEINDGGTEANFSFNINIEKRGIQLSDDEIREKIDSLNDSIKKWEDASEKLGQTVKGFNAACLAVGTTLTVKNFFSDLDGEAIARKEVMRSDGGWFDVCGQKVSRGEFSTVDQCLLENSDKIDSDVEKVHNAIQEQDAITEENVGEKLPGIRDELGGEIVNPRDSDEVIDVSQGSDVYDSLSEQGYEEGKISLTQARDIERLTKILGSSPSPELEALAKRKLYSITSDVNENAQSYSTYKSIQSELEGSGFGNIGVNSYGSSDAREGTYSGGTISGDKVIGAEGLEANTQYPAEVVVYNNKKYFVLLEGEGSNFFIAGNGNRIYEYESSSADGVSVSKTTEEERNEIRRAFSGFRKFDRTTYRNKFESPEVRYFETEPYKGLPSVVPFDLQNGWYAGMKQTVAGFGNLRTYDDSGAVGSFYVCNVGEDGREDFLSGASDDICRGFNSGSGQTYGTFQGLSQSETNRLVSNAKKAIDDASRQYEAGLRGDIRILNQNVPVGPPATSVPDFQCQDFMSPKECNLLFNACDPVVCPSSRCNLGGTFHVNNVVQSGIVGSTALCLPNAREGIAVPVCLSGIKAGVDSYLSVQENYRQCLQEQLETGRTVGICDEIHSIYLCDFFWSQTAPIADVAVPKIFESLTGQSGRGGGEYAGVQSAWQNAQDSADYMTDYYGANSFEAFRAKAVEQVGSAVCKNFISASYPTDADLLDSLIEPKSPPQYTAWFSEKTFSSATVPSTSQYKVFYHIFAGENRGAYYDVYLKDPQGTSFVQANPRIDVDSGYIETGDFASETRDFTAPSGYQQLCVNVNGQEECGFKQVSTSFAVDYLKDEYLAQQGSQIDIRTESECVSGTSSSLSLLNPNVQDGVSEVVSPELYNRGIVRVCSTDNPGQGTDPQAGTQNGRWIEVGSCDNGQGNLKCYLDTESVENTIQSTDLENQTLSEARDNVIGKLFQEGEFIEDFEGTVDKIMKLSAGDKVNTIDDELIGKAFYSYQKAKLLLIRGNAYSDIALSAISGLIEEAIARDGSDVTESENETSAGASDIQTVQQAYEEARSRTGSYDDNADFVDSIHEKGILEDYQYDDIIGKGVLNTKKDIDYIKEILKFKATDWTIESASDEADNNRLLAPDSNLGIKLRGEKYSDNVPLRTFVDVLHEKEILSDDVYEDFVEKDKTRNDLRIILQNLKLPVTI